VFTSVARYDVPVNNKKRLRPGRDVAIVARYEVPGNKKKAPPSR
jgi:hypothetical protein